MYYSKSNYETPKYFQIHLLKQKKNFFSSFEYVHHLVCVKAWISIIYPHSAESIPINYLVYQN